MRDRSLVSILRTSTSPRTKATLCVLVALGVAARLAVVAVALAIANADARSGSVLGIATAALMLGQRLLGARARIAIDCDAHRTAAGALLESDVLVVSELDLRRTVEEGIYFTQELVGGALPAVLADVIASIVLAPILFTTVPSRIVAIAIGALVTVAGGVFALRRVTRHLQEHAVEARMRLGNTFTFAIEGRLELVARGAEAEFTARLEREIDTYAYSVQRSSFGSALLGRIPIAAGIGLVAALVALDDASRAALAEAAVRSALVLAACIPPFLGAVLGAHALVRGRANVAPFIDLLRAASRNETGRERLMPPMTFKADRISFAYDKGAPPCVEGVSFRWTQAEPLVLTGPNGSGKSTVLRLLLGLRAPTSGRLRANDHDLAAIALPSLRRHVAYVPQRPYLGEPHLTVRAVLAHVRPRASDDELRVVLERVGLHTTLGAGAAAFERRLGELSGGQRQRLALARALLHDAHIYLFDEPDANLDQAGIALVVALMRQLLAEGKMVAAAAHTDELAALSSSPLRLAPKIAE